MDLFYLVTFLSLEMLIKKERLETLFFEFVDTLVIFPASSESLLAQKQA
jgi:hypothetical protein